MARRTSPGPARRDRPAESRRPRPGHRASRRPPGGGDRTGRWSRPPEHELPQGLAQPARFQARHPGQVGREAGTPHRQDLEHLPLLPRLSSVRSGASGPGAGESARDEGDEGSVGPVGRRPPESSSRRPAARRASRSDSRGRAAGGSRFPRMPAPPRSLEAARGPARGRPSLEPGRGVKVLPAEQEVGEDLGSDGDALAAADRHAQAMDLGEVLPLGPPLGGLLAGRGQPDHLARLDPALEQLGGQLGRDRVARGQLGQTDQRVGLQVAADDRDRGRRDRACRSGSKARR